jgi:hypothetical protein
MIKREGAKWVLYSSDGSKQLGVYDSKKEAEAREAQIEYFKRKKKETGNEKGKTV